MKVLFQIVFLCIFVIYLKKNPPAFICIITFCSCWAVMWAVLWGIILSVENGHKESELRSQLCLIVP